MFALKVPANPLRAIKSAVDSLVEITQNLVLATIGDQLYMSGISNLFSQPEFARWSQLFTKLLS